jgi:putative FmdB family regulatory protein
VPTYQYACTACGHQLEAVQSFTDEPLTECPACEGKLRKVFSAVGVVFKGSGFYRTDSRSNSKSTSPSGSSPSSAATGGEGAKTTSETKPAASTSSDKAPAGSSSTGSSSSGSSNSAAG